MIPDTQLLPPPTERLSVDPIMRDHQLILDTVTLDVMADALPDFLFILNEYRQIVYANRAALRALGVSSIMELYGQRPGEALSCVNADLEPCGCGCSVHCVVCGAARAIISSLTGQRDVQDCRIRRHDGSALDLQVSTKPLDIGSRRFSVFIAKDIAAEKRRRALERIFFHDVLNTAGVVMGYAELLHSGDLADAPATYESLLFNARRLVDEIAAQRDLMLAEHDDLHVRVQPVSSRELLEEVAQAYRRHKVGRDREIMIAPESQDVELVSDPVLLRRVLGNMVKNALEAAQAGQTVTLYCAQVGEAVAFSIHNPQYIPPSVQLQIFQRSFSTKGEGRGLGTYSMKLLGERYLGGQVSFVSTQAQGTTFTARFPLQFSPRA